MNRSIPAAFALSLALCFCALFLCPSCGDDTKSGSRSPLAADKFQNFQPIFRHIARSASGREDGANQSSGAAAIGIAAYSWLHPVQLFARQADGTLGATVERLDSDTKGGIHAAATIDAIERALPDIQVRKALHASAEEGHPSGSVRLDVVSGQAHYRCWIEPEGPLYFHDAADPASPQSWEVLNADELREAVAEGVQAHPGEDAYEQVIELCLAYPNSLSTGLEAYSEQEIADWKAYLTGLFTPAGAASFGFDAEGNREPGSFEAAARAAKGRLQVLSVNWNAGTTSLDWEAEVSWLPPVEKGWGDTFTVAGTFELDAEGKIEQVAVNADGGLMDAILE